MAFSFQITYLYVVFCIYSNNIISRMLSPFSGQIRLKCCVREIKVIRQLVEEHITVFRNVLIAQHRSHILEGIAFYGKGTFRGDTTGLGPEDNLSRTVCRQMIGGLSRHTPGSLLHHGTCRIARGYLETVVYRCHNIVLTDRIIIGRSVVTAVVVFTVVIIEVECSSCRVELEVNDIDLIRSRLRFQSCCCGVCCLHLEPSVAICSALQSDASGIVTGGYY